MVVLAVFVLHQQRTRAPALDLDLFRITNFRWANVAMLVFGTAFAALFLGSILFLTQVWGWSVLQAGFGVAPGPIMVGLVAPRAGKLAGRIGQRPILIAGGVLYASSGLYRLVMLGPDADYLVDYFPSMVLSGVGVAFVFPQLSSVVAQALPAGRAGVGGAVAQAVRQFGGTFGVALTIAFLGTAATDRRHLRRDLVAHRGRRARHVGAGPADAHRPHPPSTSPPPPAPRAATPVASPAPRPRTRNTMKIEGSVALVTGANRGLGAAFCRTLLDRGATKVYAGRVTSGRSTTPGVIPVPLDVTSAADIAAAADRCGDVTLLVNNAGIGTGTSALADDALDAARLEFETNVFGPLALAGAFAPALAANGGGAIVNVLSVLSWVSRPATAIYCASQGGRMVADQLAAPGAAGPTHPGARAVRRATWTPT